MEWRSRNFGDLRQYSMTLTGIVGLQVPCLISRAPKHSSLAFFQTFGFPFNMTRRTLDDHFSFSPENLKAGRYYTVVTNLFHHADVDHLISNLRIFMACGYDVHRRYGRTHLLASFIGGGATGNLTQLAQYLYQQVNWKNIFPAPSSCGIFSNTFGRWLDSWQTSALETVYETVNAWRPCIGASAAVSSIIAIEACTNFASLMRKIERFQARNRQIPWHWPEDDVLFETLYELVQLAITALLVFEDLMLFVDSTRRDRGILGSLIAYSVDGIGHAAHLGGFLFGVFYYSTFLSKIPHRRFPRLF